MFFSASLHDSPDGSGHDGWRRNDLNGSTQVMRAFITGYKADENGRTRWQCESRDGCKYENVEYMTPAGVMTSPKVDENAEGFIITANGDHSQCMFVPCGDANLRQASLKEGELGLANPNKPDQQILFDADGNIRINAPGKKVFVDDAQDVVLKATNVTIDAQNVALNSKDITIIGDIEHTGSLTSTGIHKARSHV